MASALLVIIFLILLAFSTSLQKVFSRLPAVELKRRARRGDPAARQLYKLAAHTTNLRTLVWIFIIFSAALVFIFLADSLSFFPALVIILALIWLGFIWLPASPVADLELRLAGLVAGPLGQLLAVLDAPLDLLNDFVKRHSPVTFHTGMYEKADLLKLLDAQKRQADNRIDQEALDVAMRGLTFGDKIVEDYMTPRSHVATVNAGDSVSPKLIDELHKSGQNLFPVVEGKPEQIVGTLRLAELVDLRKSGLVKNLMSPRVYYIHEDHGLAQVLDAFYKTRHHLFIVVNKFEDFVGVITLEDALEQIIGKPILSDFDDYASHEAVAKHVARTAIGSEPQTDDLVAEVVES